MRTEAVLLIGRNCFGMWWAGTELNRRRQPFQGCALPPELPGHPEALPPASCVTLSTHRPGTPRRLKVTERRGQSNVVRQWNSKIIAMADGFAQCGRKS